MEDETTSKPRMRQLLWIGAGVAVLTALVLAGSWLFSPRAPDRAAVAPAAGLKEEEVQKETFRPEAPAQLPETAPATTSPPLEPEQPPAEAAPLTSGMEQEQNAARNVEAEASQPPAATPKEAPPTSASGSFGVQVGAFSSQANARDVVRRLKAAGFKSSVLEKGGRFKVVVGGYADRPSAEKALTDMRRAGFTSAFIVSLEEP